jgi:hypothetical protein
MIHSFKVKVLRKTKNAHIELTREFDESKSCWRNAYTLKLTCGGQPLAGKELEFWFVERGKPGYDSWNKMPLEERMKIGGEVLRVRTDENGIARVSLPQLDEVESPHHTTQIVVRYNADRGDPDYKAAQTPQFEFYSKQIYG